MLPSAAHSKTRTPSLFDFKQQAVALPSKIVKYNGTYTRNSLKNVPQGNALVQLAANQFGNSLDSVTSKYGYVPEPAATNLLSYSEDFSAAAVWIHFNITETINATTAPNGSNTADLVTSTSAVSSYYNQGVTVTSGVPYTLSAFVKYNNARYVFLGSNTGGVDKYCIFDTTTGTITSTGAGCTASTPEALSGGWYRISVTFTTTTTSLSGNFARATAGPADITPINGGSVYAWGVQLETGPRTTSYIATTVSTASRSGEALTVPLWVNNLKDSQDIAAASWAKTNCSVTTTGSAPDGTATAQLISVTASAATSLYNLSIKAPSAVVTASIYIKQGSKPTADLLLRNDTTSTNFNLGSLTFATGIITGAGWSVQSVGNGWYRCIYTQSSGISVGDTLRVYAHFVGSVESAGATAYAWGAQLEPGTTATPYRPTVNNLEYARNYLSYSEDFSNGVWGRTNCTVTGNVIVAPNGTTTGDRLVETSGTGFHYVQHSAQISTNTTFSFYAKAGERTRIGFYRTADSNGVCFDLNAITVLRIDGTNINASSGYAGSVDTSASIVDVGDGWRRCTMTRGAASTATGAHYLAIDTGYQSSYTGDPTKGLYVWGAQLEQGSVAGPYEPTNTITPSANANIPGFSSAGYTLFADCFASSGGAVNVSPIGVSDGSAPNRSDIYYDITNKFAAESITSGVTQSNFYITGSASASRTKAAAVFSSNSFLSALGGAAGNSDISGSIPVGLVTLHIGTVPLAATNAFNGYIFEAGLFPAVLTQAQINGKTTL